MKAADTVIVQNFKTNTFISITKKIREAFPISKGDKLLVMTDGKKITIEKSEED